MQNCIECSENKKVVHVSVKGMFRCHYDFPDCSNISRRGDSSLVILRIESINVDSPAEPVILAPVASIASSSEVAVSDEVAVNCFS